MILTSLESPFDDREDEMLGVSAYLRKPIELAEFTRTGKEIAGLLSDSAV